MHTKDLRLFRRSDATVNELTGMEDGRWKVEAVGGSYIFDLEMGTVTRHHGDETPSSTNDDVRRLGRIEACRVGQPGIWAVRAGGYLNAVEYWQRSTEVRTIERLSSHAV